MFDYDEKPELNITPLVDVMLVLLAILMVTMPAIIYEEQILLPQGSSTKVSKQTNFIIKIDSNKNIYINQTKMSFSEFPDNLIIGGYDKSSRVFIQADKNLLYNDVMFVLSTLKKAGFSKVSLQTSGN